DRGVDVRGHRRRARMQGGHREVARPSRTPATQSQARAVLEWRCSMEDHRVSDLLRELPREQARPEFTARVLERLPSPKRIPRPNARLVLALAAVLAMATVSTGILVERQ